METLKQLFMQSTSAREFVVRAFESRRKENRHFTLQAFAIRAHFKSRSYPHLILTGKRSITLKNCDQIALGLNLCPELAEAFRIQVTLEKRPESESLKQQMAEIKARFNV